MTITVANHQNFLALINELLSDSQAVLDIGCGLGFNLAELCCPIKIGVDAYRPYLERARSDKYFIKLNFSAEGLRDLFLPDSVDSVTLIDVIEHFEKKTALDILNQAEEIALKNVIVFTPRGFFQQEEVDHYGMGGGYYQRHRSGWEVEDFHQLGYNVVIFKKFHDHKNAAFVETYGSDAPPIDALLAWKDCRLEHE